MNTCFYCDMPIPKWATEYDHYPVPASSGGKTTVPACLNCHNLKDRAPLEDWDSSAAVQGARDLLSVWDMEKPPPDLDLSGMSPASKVFCAKAVRVWYDAETLDPGGFSASRPGKHLILQLPTRHTEQMNPKAQNNKCVIYCRLSRLTGERQGGLERQEEDGLTYAKRHGFEVVAVLKEAQSAYAEKERPKLKEAMRLLASGEATHLVCYKYDRLSRGGISGLTKILDQLEEAGASLHLVTEGIDATTSAGRIILSVLSEIARSEAENTSLRYKRMHEARAAAGKKHNRSYGFLPDGTQVPDEVEKIREAAQWVLDNKSLRSLALKWNEEGVLTSTGKTGSWVSKTISRMLEAPSLRGVRLANGIDLPGDWEPIFTAEEHAAIMGAIRSNPKKRRLQSLLGNLGVLVCAECGHTLRAAAAPSENRAERYSCPSAPEGCGKVSIARFGADTAAIEAFIKTVDAWEHPLSLPAVDVLQAQLDQDEESLKQLTTARFVDRAISDDAYLPAHDQLQERISEARAQIRARANQPVVKADLPEPGNAQGWWDGASLEEQRRALRVVIKKVSVKRTGPTGPRLNPERITVELNTNFLWKTVSRWGKEHLPE